MYSSVLQFGTTMTTYMRSLQGGRGGSLHGHVRTKVRRSDVPRGRVEGRAVTACRCGRGLRTSVEDLSGHDRGLQ